MTRSEILDAAKKCVCGQREQDYGTPESNFQLIADLWNSYLNLPYHHSDINESRDTIPEISAKDVAMMMALLKIARIKNGGGTGDSFVDLAGYAACGGEICSSNEEKNVTVENIYKVKKVCATCKFHTRMLNSDPCNECINECLENQKRYTKWEPNISSDHM